MPGLKLTEADVALACVHFLEAEGWNVHRLTADRHSGLHQKRHEKTIPGTPDYLVIKVSQVSLRPTIRMVEAFYLEVKRPDGTLRQSQKLWLANATKRGYTTCVTDSFGSLKTWYLERFGLRTPSSEKKG